MSKRSDAILALNYVKSKEFMGGNLFYKNGGNLHNAQEMIANHPCVETINDYLSKPSLDDAIALIEQMPLGQFCGYSSLAIKEVLTALKGLKGTK